MRLATAAIVFVCTTAPAVPVSADAGRAQWALRLDAGSEFDSNVHRVEEGASADQDAVAAPVARGGGKVDLSWRRTATQRLTATGHGGGKLFLSEDAADENVVFGSLDARYDVVSKSRRSMYTARGALYESFGYDPGRGATLPGGRNFSTALAEGLLRLAGPDEHRIELAAGYRRFHYKLDGDFDWRGPEVGVRYQNTWWRGEESEAPASVELNFGYRVGLRDYTGRAFANGCSSEMTVGPMCFLPTALARTDVFHILAGELVYTGDRLYSMKYEASVADSNSFGQSLLRHRIEAGVTSEVGAGFFTSARLALVIDDYLDPLIVARDVLSQSFSTIDEENRSSASVHVSRDLGQVWSIEARYAVITRALASDDTRFFRQVVYAGAVAAWSP